MLGAGVDGRADRRRTWSTPSVPVVLFDLPAKEGPKNGIALRAIENLKKLSPAPLGMKDDGRPDPARQLRRRHRHAAASATW